MVSNRQVPDRLEHMCRCPKNHEHRPIEGQLHGGQRVSSFVATYTPKFVKTMLRAFRVGQHDHHATAVNLHECHMECLAVDADDPSARAPDAEGSLAQESNSEDDAKIKATLAKLHRNLGHPSTQDMCRILRHSRASDRAIQLAGQLQCTVCQNHQQPKSALPANVPHSFQFNHHIGMDVKYLQGWRTNQRVPCVNIVDYGTSMQVMVPIYVKESAEVLKKTLRDQWMSWAGPPVHLTTDSAKPNISEAMSDFCDDSGITMHQIAADARWQLGKVERHGQWFSRIFDRVCSEVHPTNAEQFADCVAQTQMAKNSLISQSGASPCQLVFGRNPS